MKARVVIVAGALGLLALASLTGRPLRPTAPAGEELSVSSRRNVATDSRPPSVPRLQDEASRGGAAPAVRRRSGAIHQRTSDGRPAVGRPDAGREATANEGGYAGADVTMTTNLQGPDRDAPIVSRDVRGRRANTTHERFEDIPDGILESAGVTYDSGDESEFPTDARFEVPEDGGISGSSGSVSFQFEPAWSGDNQADATLVEIGDGRLVIRKNVSYLRVEMTSDDGAVSGAGASLAKWQPGETYQVTATWGNGRLALYIDGQLASQRPYASDFDISTGTPAFIGNGPHGAVAPGALSNVQLSTVQLSPAEVAQRVELSLSHRP